ncbi:geranylgeranylglyceryl/heptaprenylglyceryl phosphate synthase [Candidatus Parcubacteria bacterium]|nr:geranylgeranylglyceryl/heptaprenylglyceryl phosphate synthase [Candidatus Parcubacteria bacterium]
MENTIKQWIEAKGKLHFSLIDPDKQTPDEAGEMADFCVSCGTDAIMVGGSTIDFQKSQETTIAIKDAVNVPVVLFPSSAEAINEFADYIFFMKLMNSKKRQFIMEEQLRGAPLVKKFGLIPISMGYVLIGTSERKTAVEQVSGNLDIIEKDDVEKALKYALTTQYFGMSCVYLEAGSGAEKPVSNKMIRMVKKEIDIPLIVGGGIRNAATARKKIKSGADIIVTGTVIEKDKERLKEIISVIKK